MSATSLRFANRIQAGQKLASALSAYHERPLALVLGLPRGGVPVAYEVAKALHLPLDIWLVRKLGVPGQEELALGAVSENQGIVLNEDVIQALGIDSETINNLAAKKKAELEKRRHLYRKGSNSPNLQGKVVLVVDDGLATGATLRAALESVRQAGASWVVAAVPVGAPTTCKNMESYADDVVCLLQPAFFQGVGQWYDDFSPTTDEDVKRILAA